MPSDRDTLLRAAMICAELASRYHGYAGERDNPDAHLDSAFATGAEECAKAIRLEAERLGGGESGGGDATESATWPYVLAFAREMEAKLAGNRHKGDREGWRSLSEEHLLALLRKEVSELAGAMKQLRPNAAVVSECADVANFAMMIADVAGRLAAAPAPPTGAPLSPTHPHYPFGDYPGCHICEAQKARGAAAAASRTRRISTRTATHGSSVEPRHRGSARDHRQVRGQMGESGRWWLACYLAAGMLSGGCAHAGERIPIVRVDTIAVSDTHGMRCCCPCDYYAVRALYAGNARTGMWLALDTLEHVAVNEDAAAWPLKTAVHGLFDGHVFASRDEFFRTVARWAFATVRR